MAPSGISINKPAAFAIIALLAGGIVFYRWGWSSSPAVPGTDSMNIDKDISAGDKPDAADEKPDIPDSQPDATALFAKKEIDVTGLPVIPVSTEEQLKMVAVKETSISVTVQGKILSIFSQQTSPTPAPPTQTAEPVTVLLLHGAKYSSQDWVSISTLQRLALWGYRAIAVDLPEHGKSKDVSLGEVPAEEFLSALVGAIGATPVIVSPSMSGSYSLPYLFSDPSASLQRAKAFVPVAPVSTDKYTASFPKSQLPTLIVYGTEDKLLGEQSKNNLQTLPQSHIASIPEASHACYLDKPDLFHTVLYHFLASLKR